MHRIELRSRPGGVWGGREIPTVALIDLSTHFRGRFSQNFLGSLKIPAATALKMLLWHD
jgi:hypothetical protein